MSKPAIGSIHALLGIVCPVKIVDIGANPIDGAAPYAPLYAAGQAHIVGFEPNHEALAELNRQKKPHDLYLAHAVGDGKRHTLHHCVAGGMTSLFPPDQKILSLFHSFAEWGSVVRTEEVDTRRLDDIPETAGVDFLKIDIQGAEYMVLANAPERLKQALVVHTEVEFLPMYTGQPLYAEIDQLMRGHGFILHRFEPMYHRTLKPVDPYAGLNQLLWADAIFIRDFTRLDRLKPEELLKLAVIMHECYSAYDITLHLLAEYDRRQGTQHHATYLDAVQHVQTRLAFNQTVKN